MVAVFHIPESEFDYLMDCIVVFFLFLSDFKYH